jgi:hypothetical protein
MIKSKFFRVWAFVLAFHFYPTLAQTQPSTAFNMNAAQPKKIEVSTIVSRDTTFDFPCRDSAISGLSINMKISIISSDYLVRILLEDINGENYLVAESYKELFDEENILFTDYCEETAILDNILPKKLHVYVKNANVTINSLLINSDSLYTSDKESFLDVIKTVRQNQVKEKIKRINTYNRTNNKLWYAGMTGLGMMSHSEKMRYMGIKENQTTNGFEFYIDGIYEIGEQKMNNRSQATSNYVSNFSWKNRHGKNWQTSVKNQGGSMYCAAFATNGVLESLANLYFNRMLDLDLSDQQVAACNKYQHPDVYHCGMHVDSVVLYVYENAVYDETAYPFYDGGTQACQCDIRTPNYTAQASGFHNITGGWDDIKSELIHNGPLVSGYVNGWNGHAMALVGYGTVVAGQHYSFCDNAGTYPYFHPSDTIQAGDPRVGQTYWIFKDSYYGEREYEYDGYMYLIFNNRSDMINTFALEWPITTWNVPNCSIICEDADGDGYYFWGVGPKPANCPSWVPNTPDGDDSDINYGAMDEYGNLAGLPFGQTIKTEVTFTDPYILINYGIVNNGVFRITESTAMIGGAKMRVCENGVMTIDGGSLNNPNIEMIPSSTLVIRNNGSINLTNGNSFEIPNGVTMQIENGSINISTN